MSAGTNKNVGDMAADIWRRPDFVGQYSTARKKGSWATLMQTTKLDEDDEDAE